MLFSSGQNRLCVFCCVGLPHLSAVSSWYNVIDAEPGFAKEALTALQAKVLAGERDGQEVVRALMLDDMSIRKHVQWDGKAGKYRGFVDMARSRRKQT